MSKHYSKNAIKDYKDWLKSEIYDKDKLPTDFKKKWGLIKQRNYTFKTDYETMMQDKAEEEFYDNQ